MFGPNLIETYLPPASDIHYHKPSRPECVIYIYMYKRALIEGPPAGVFQNLLSLKLLVLMPPPRDTFIPAVALVLLRRSFDTALCAV